MSLVLFLALTAMPEPTTVEWLQHLKAEPLEQTRPKAIVIQNREFASSTAISFYETTSSDGTGPTRTVWHARREVRAGEGLAVEWTSTRSCGQLFSVVIALERLAMPHVEMRRPQTSESPTPAPEMGSTHQNHLVWVTGWDSGNAPLQLTLESLGSGTPQQLYDLANDQLSGCWLPTGEPHWQEP